ncbi:hypothetical protein GCM10010187_71920 [Actinomadura coerulea]|nr:hypothetical protein GCM10010187_71920 [Actinomadura coerulea]
MNEADALVSLRERYSSWEISLNHGMWQAKGRILIRSSSLSLLQAAMDGEPPFPSRLAKERVRVAANGSSTPRPDASRLAKDRVRLAANGSSTPRPEASRGVPEQGRKRWWRGAVASTLAITKPAASAVALWVVRAAARKRPDPGGVVGGRLR